MIGANGAGKSTLMRTLAGLEKPLAGRVLFNDEDITGSKPEDIVRMGIALVPEGRSTIPDLTVAENLKLGGMWRTHAQRATSLTARLCVVPGARRAPTPRSRHLEWWRTAAVGHWSRPHDRGRRRSFSMSLRSASHR